VNWSASSSRYLLGTLLKGLLQLIRRLLIFFGLGGRSGFFGFFSLTRYSCYLPLNLLSSSECLFGLLLVLLIDLNSLFVNLSLLLYCLKVLGALNLVGAKKYSTTTVSSANLFE
jgi:hypothetical protein